MADKGRSSRGKQVQAQEEQRRLSKEELLQPRIHEEDLTLEGFGGVVRARSLSVRQRRELREQCGFGTEQWDEDKFTKLMIQESLLEPKLTDSDIAELEKMNMVLYDELVIALTIFNTVGKVEERKKGLKETKSSDSASALQSV